MNQYQKLFEKIAAFEKLATMSPEEAANLLGVAPDASPEEINKAHKKMVFQFHPDRNPSPEAADKMVAINVARDILRNMLDQIGRHHQKPKEPVKQERAWERGRSDRGARDIWNRFRDQRAGANVNEAIGPEDFDPFEDDEAAEKRMVIADKLAKILRHSRHPFIAYTGDHNVWEGKDWYSIEVILMSLPEDAPGNARFPALDHRQLEALSFELVKELQAVFPNAKISNTLEKQPEVTLRNITAYMPKN
jgi:DnaJ domain